MVNLGIVSAIKTITDLGDRDHQFINRYVDGSGNLIAYYWSFDGGSTWKTQQDLFQFVHTDTTAPAETWKLWENTNFNPSEYYKYNGSAWRPFVTIVKSQDASSGLTISDDTYHGKVLQNTTATDCTITLNSGASIDFACLIEKIGTGRVVITAAAGVYLNGVEAASFEIDSQFAAASLRQYDTDYYSLIGDLL